MIFSRILRLLGPWTCRLWSWSVESLTQARRPRSCACWRIQRPLMSLPPIQREVLTAQAKDRPVVDHAAGFVAHGCVDDLAVGELADVAGDAGLHQQFGVGACDFVFTQGERSMAAAACRQAQYSSVAP